MNNPEKVQAGFIIKNLVNFCRWGDRGLREAPDTLKQILKDKLYKCFVKYGTEEIVTFENFNDFCKAAVVDGGLGASVEMVKNLCRDDEEAINLIDIELQRPVGRPPKQELKQDDDQPKRKRGRPKGSKNKPKETEKSENPIDNKYIQPEPEEKSEEIVNIIDNKNTINERPRGTAQQTGHRLLRVKRPDLHQEVLNGKKSIHAACVEAGLRPKTCTIRLDNIKSIAKVLTKNLEKDKIEELIVELSNSLKI